MDDEHADRIFSRRRFPCRVVARRATDSARTRRPRASYRSATLRLEIGQMGQRRHLPRTRPTGLLGRRRLSPPRSALEGRGRRTFSILTMRDELRVGKRQEQEADKTYLTLTAYGLLLLPVAPTDSLFSLQLPT